MADGRIDQLPALVAELDDAADDEHPDVSISDAAGWTLSAFPSGLVVFENLEEDGLARHLTEIDRARVLELFTMLAGERLGDLESVPWNPGYGD